MRSSLQRHVRVFFVWDTISQSGFAARDCLGIKPFVYAYDDGVLYFASEAKAIVAARPVRPKLNVDAVLEYFVARISAAFRRHHLTVSKSCRLVALPASADTGCVLKGGIVRTASGGCRSCSSYRQSGDTGRSCGGRSATNIVCGCSGRRGHLSGGLDSTLIAAIAQKNSSVSLPAYTINYSGPGCLRLRALVDSPV